MNHDNNVFYPYRLCPSGRCVDKYQCELCGQCRDRVPTTSKDKGNNVKSNHTT